MASLPHKQKRRMADTRTGCRDAPDAVEVQECERHKRCEEPRLPTRRMASCQQAVTAQVFEVTRDGGALHRRLLRYQNLVRGTTRHSIASPPPWHAVARSHSSSDRRGYLLHLLCRLHFFVMPWDVIFSWYWERVGAGGARTWLTRLWATLEGISLLCPPVHGRHSRESVLPGTARASKSHPSAHNA